jgi:rhodanese-related sulfurtransferase
MYLADPSIVFIDVRSQATSVLDCIHNGRLDTIGWGTCASAILALPRNGKYIVYDAAGGSDSTYIVGWMKANGTANAGLSNPTAFTTVYRITGGIAAWKAAGLPTAPHVGSYY